MKVLLINQTEVRQLLPMNECIEIMVEALSTLARGDAILPLRPILWLPERVGALGMMPAFLGNINAVGLKVITVFPGNHGTEYDSHQGAVLLFETKHGQLLAMMDASEITAIRTAAVQKARMYVDRRESTVNEAGDFLFPKKEGAITDDHIQGEIGEILLGKVAGRGSPDEITVFKSLGLAVEDLAAAQHIYRKAVEQGRGAAIELGGGRDDD